MSISKKKNMYWLSKKQWNPFVGCKHICIYCTSSFQRQLKRYSKKTCKACYNFTPHTHKQKLNQMLPHTPYLKFIFTCANGDIRYCRKQYFLKIIDIIRQNPDKNFLIQTKDPKKAFFFRDGKQVKFPNNVILGITLETNRDKLYTNNFLVSKAPKPFKRYQDFLKVKHPIKMVTIEPVIDFDIDIMIQWIDQINPSMVWLGYDSGNHL